MNQTIYDSQVVLDSKKDDLLFVLLNEVEDASVCTSGFKLELLQTSQGVYLYKHSTYLMKLDLKIKRLPMSTLTMEHFQEKDYRDLTFAENDSKFLSLKKAIEKMECAMMVNSIRAHLHNDDTFLTLNYLGKQ